MEKGKLSQPDSKNHFLKSCIESYVKEKGKPQKHSILTNFKLRDGKLYHKDKSTLLAIRGGKLRSIGEIVKILGNEGLHDLGFNIPIEGKVTAQQAIMLNKAEEEMPSTSEVANADDIELQKITENAARSTESLIEQLERESSKDLPMHELRGLDKQLRSIRGSLKVEMSKKVQLEERIKIEKCKLEEI